MRTQLSPSRQVPAALLAALALLAACQPEASSVPPPDSVEPPPGLTVRDGQLLRHDKPFRAMGINYFTCLVDHLRDPREAQFIEGFRILKEDYQIPFVRFMAGPYAHTGWRLYQEDKAEYFRRFDEVVAAAEAQGIGLIPSLFWYVATMPDLAGEPLSALGDRDSRCRIFMRQYLTEVVTRYQDSPAIWGWEVANEWMLHADLPKLNHLPRPKIGSDQERTAEDKLLRPMILDVYIDFYETVRAIDPERIIVTGDSIARAQAWHNHHEDRWAQDSKEQWESIFRQDTPERYEVVSFHLYAEADYGYFEDKDLPIEAFVRQVVEICREDGKLIWCGELGMPGTDAEAREMFFRMMDSVEANRIDISAIWNFMPEGQAQPDWDISPGNERAYMLEAVKELNERFAIGNWQ